MPPALFYSKVTIKSVITAEARFKQKIKKIKIKFINKAKTKENVPFEIDSRKSRTLSKNKIGPVPISDFDLIATSIMIDKK